MTITWNGRAYVDMEWITPEEYKTFFDINENGIRFDVANEILGKAYREGCEEVVPCDELNADSRACIASCISHGMTRGTLSRAGQRLIWSWEPDLSCEGEPLSVADLHGNTLAEIAWKMLEKQARCGICEN